jgi:hypothetical protein
MEITRRGKIEYRLKLPNEEVKSSFNDVVLDFLTNQRSDKLVYQNDIYDAICDAKLDDLENSLKSMFASIPYNNFTNNNLPHYEGYYASVIYVYFQSLGINIIGEDVTNKARIDLTLFIEDKIYIVEFKVGNTDALQQIKDKVYHQKYLSQNKDIYLVGINFDEKERNISKFEWELVSFFK